MQITKNVIGFAQRNNASITIDVIDGTWRARVQTTYDLFVVYAPTLISLSYKLESAVGYDPRFPVSEVSQS